MKIKKKSLLISFSLVCLMLILAACGGSKWEGTYGGTSTSDSKVEIEINKDGTVTYQNSEENNGEKIEGEWEEQENSIELDFNDEVSNKSEPLIVTLASDKESITIESDNSSWNPDTYQRR